MEKIWLNSYPPGIPAEINPDAYHSLLEIFDISFKQYYDQPAFYNLGKTITFGQLEKYSRNFAAFLQTELNLKKGDRFAIMLPNTLQYPIAMFGAMRAGLIIVNVNPLYTFSELRHQLKDAEASGITVLANFVHSLEKALPDLPQLKHIIVSNLGDMLPAPKNFFINFLLKYIYKKVPEYHLSDVHYFKNVLRKGSDLPFVTPSIINHDIAFLQYTGGTTGISKGAVLTHRNIIANIQQADAWFKNLLTLDQEIIITALPLYHIFSLTANCIYFVKIGGFNVLITNPRDLKSMVKDMRKFKFTAITGVNTLFNGLLKLKSFATLNFSKLQLTLGGGMAVQKIVAEKWQKITKVPLLEAYGLTETSPCVSINPINLKAYNGSIGLPVSSTDILILDEDLQEVPIGEPGELVIKGPQVMQAYWKNPAETEKAFTKDGWFLTGDIVSIDKKGFLFLHERKKDMILVSGFNVYPNEIEDVLAKLPGVREVAVIGIPDQNSGEAPKAFIVKEDPNLSPEAIIKFARKYLTAYKIPKKIEFRDELPKSAIGKILRRALKNNAYHKETRVS